MAIIDKAKNRTYVKMEGSMFDGVPILSEVFGNGSTPMILEPIPEMLLRSTDQKISGEFDNNAAIIFGRDRHPFERRGGKIKEKVSVDPSEENYLESGFSSHQGAGAIDIVVGRGAPYPVEMSGASKLPPLYTTITDPKIVGGEISPGVRRFTNEKKHNGVMMDAARIYLSQMSNVDKYFKITTIAKGMQYPKPGTSGIVLKGDNLRMHARRDVKIIAGGDFEQGPHQIDSAGNILFEHPKIHLMVGNGKKGYTDAQPVPMGNNLIECIKSILNTQQNIYEVVNLMNETQKAMNTILTHYIPVVAPGQTGPPNPVNLAMGKIKMILDIINSMNIYFEKFYNNPTDRSEFTDPYSDRYILSRSVFINSKKDSGQSLLDAEERSRIT